MVPALRRIFACALAFLWTAVAPLAGGDEPEYAAPPDWVVPVKWAVPELVKSHPSGQDYLLHDEQVNVATGESYTQRVSQVVSDAGLRDAGQLTFDFDPSYQTLILHHVRLVRGTVASDRLDRAKVQVFQQERDLEWQLYNGRRSAHLILDDVRIGDVIDVAYTVRGRNPVFGGKFIDVSWLEWGVPVRDLRYRLLVPEGRKIRHRIVGLKRGATYGLHESRNGEEIAWSRTDVAAVESEDRMPRWHYAYAFLDLSEFESWSDVVSWGVPLYEFEPDQGPMLSEAIEELRARGGSPEQQTVAALEFVQQEIRYLGIEMGAGSHKPSAPSEVLRRRFGDCKDKTLLLVALLRGLGLDAVPALVNSSRREGALERLPSPYAFDHVIVALELNGQRHLLDPTLSYQRGAGLALRHTGRHGPYLRLAAGDTTGRLETAQRGPGDVDATTINHHYEVVALDKPALLTVTTRAEGLAANSLRSQFANKSTTQISRDYLDYYTRWFTGLTLKSPVEHNDDRDQNVFSITERYEIAELFESTDGGRVLKAEFQPPSVWDYARVPNLTQRQSPLSLTHPVQLSEHLTISLHEDWKIESAKGTVDDAAFTLKWSAYNPDLRTVRLEHTWESKADAVEKDRMMEYSTNAAEARRQLGYFLTWTTSAAASADVSGDEPTGANLPMVALAIVVLLISAGVAAILATTRAANFVIPPVLDSTERPVAPPELAPGRLEGLGGWLILVGFGLVVRPVMIFVMIVHGWSAYFDAQVWHRLTTPGSEFFLEHFALVAPLELMINIVLLVYSVLLLVLYFRKSHLFPGCIQVFFVCAIVTGVFEIWSAFALNQGTRDVETYKPLMQALVASAIWIPYFSVSRRVKCTFTR